MESLMHDLYKYSISGDGGAISKLVGVVPGLGIGHCKILTLL